MTIYERVELYKSLYQGSTAPTVVSKIIADGFYTLTGLEALEAIRRLNTDLSDYYQVSIPVITVWVRDDKLCTGYRRDISYRAEFGGIFASIQAPPPEHREAV